MKGKFRIIQTTHTTSFQGILDFEQNARVVVPYHPHWRELSTRKLLGMVNPLLSFPESYAVAHNSHLAPITSLAASPLVHPKAIGLVISGDYASADRSGFSLLVRGQSRLQGANHNLPRSMRGDNSTFSPVLHKMGYGFEKGLSMTKELSVARQFTMMSPFAEIIVVDPMPYSAEYLMDLDGTITLSCDDFFDGKLMEEFEVNVGQFIVPESIVARRSLSFGFYTGPWVYNMGYIDSRIMGPKLRLIYGDYVEKHTEHLKVHYDHKDNIIRKFGVGFFKKDLMNELPMRQLAEIVEMRVVIGKMYNEHLREENLPFLKFQHKNALVPARFFKKKIDSIREETDLLYGSNRLKS